jgi:hypothetical protein
VTTVILALVSVIAVSLVSLVGLATIAMDEMRVRRLATLFVSFAVESQPSCFSSADIPDHARYRDYGSFDSCRMTHR